MKWQSYCLLLFPLLCLGGLGCSRQNAEAAKAAAPANAEPAPLEVKAGVAETRRVERSVALTGSLLPDETVDLAAEVPGTLSSINVDFGQNVRKGDVVAQLDQREFSWQVERSRAALSQALARIGLNPGQEEINPDSTPAIRQAVAQYEDARSKFDTAKRLVASGDIARERYVELEKAHLAREAAVQAARDDLRTQLAGIQALRAEVKLAMKRLQDTAIRAPFDGAISARLASPGQFLKENTPVATLVKSSPLRLRAEIPESAVAGVRIGTPLTFTTDAAPNAVFRAVVRELNPSLDARSRSLTAEARLLQSDARLKPGMFVQAKVVTSQNASIVVVPSGAVYAVAGLTKVFVIENGKAAERHVPPGQPIGGWVEVPEKSVRPGQQVALSNLALLTEGRTVQVRQ
ncbi:MAG: efflux RND transporter periplasmic adaptor subunit [Bryobacteraceae bacterium]